MLLLNSNFDKLCNLLLGCATRCPIRARNTISASDEISYHTSSNLALAHMGMRAGGEDATAA